MGFPQPPIGRHTLSLFEFGPPEQLTAAEAGAQAIASSKMQRSIAHSMTAQRPSSRRHRRHRLLFNKSISLLFMAISIQWIYFSIRQQSRPSEICQ